LGFGFFGDADECDWANWDEDEEGTFAGEGEDWE
jgi:hypothetical protein